MAASVDTGVAILRRKNNWGEVEHSLWCPRCSAHIYGKRNGTFVSKLAARKVAVKHNEMHAWVDAARLNGHGDREVVEMVTP